jgi:hypothetical protein
MKSLSMLAVLLLLMAAVGAADAQQAVRAGLSGVGGYYLLEGDDFEEVDHGFGAEGVLRFTLLNRLQLGGGVHWSRHRIDFLDTDVSVMVIFAEPRLTFARESPQVAPFLAGRAAYALQSADVRFDGAPWRSTPPATSLAAWSGWSSR